MISVVILAELLVEYTSAIAKLTVGMLPRRQGGDSNVVRVGALEVKLKKLVDHYSPANIQVSSIMIPVVIISELLVEYTTSLAKLIAVILPRRQGDGNFVRIGNLSVYCPPGSSPVPDYSSHLVNF
ncbi:hypothetical protein Bca101_079466 [Brassica carinata]